MKRALAVILALALFATLIPAVASASGDYELEIKGGSIAANTVSVDGADCLKVDVYLNGVTAQKLLASASFSLEYDSTLLSYYTDSTALGEPYLYTVDGNGNRLSRPALFMNTAIAGTVLFALASDYGCKVEDGKPMITLYFRINRALRADETIAFTLGNDAFAESIEMESTKAGKTAVTAKRSLTASFLPYTASAVIEWDGTDVQYKGTTPYVVYNGSAQTPRFTVKDGDGNLIDPKYYTYTYRENTQPGTGYVNVTFTGDHTGGCSAFFKIYLPPTTGTTVENVQEGIKISWDAVEGAAGYVIYRRAWNSVSSGWTAFSRWNNVTGTTWTDGTDDTHKVYAGTRYQYGVKAYFAQRYDPIAEAYIGGNENAPLGNYNLGIVGPLVTTVRITTRVLNKVEADSSRLTVKWTGSKVFTGYQVQIATDQAFANGVKTVKIDKAATYETTIGNLNAATTYFVRVRSYQEFEGVTYYGQWSNVLSGTTK